MIAAPKTPGVYIVEQNAFPNSVVEVATSVTAFVGWTEKAVHTPTRIASLAEYESLFGSAPQGLGFVLYRCLVLFFANGGGPCYIASVGDYTSAPNAAALISGIQMLEEEQEPSLLAIPDAIVLPEPDCLSVQREMLRHCGQVMKSRFAILDVYSDPGNFLNGIGAVNSDFGAAYYPWLNTSAGALPPSAAMAGVYATTDAAGGVWKAPANVSLTGVTGPSVPLTDAAQAAFTPVNAIRAFEGQGTLVWGARTLDTNSEDWCYISVRRTMIVLEQSIRRAAQAYVFEPNTAATWSAMKSMINNFLTGVWERGGLQGTTAAEAFRVSCGLGETMTPDDILQGLMRVTVLLAVIRPAEFIEITFQQEMAI